MINNITIGSDPEFLVYNPETKLCVPGLPYTNGTKEEPEPIGGDFFIQKDNALLEGNIPVCTTKSDFIHNMSYLTGYLEYLVGEDGYKIIFQDSGEYNMNDLKHPELNIFGCDPYINCWTGEIIRAPSLSKKNYRTVGFHIHIGYSLDKNCPYTKDQMDQLITKAFDCLVIVPSYLIHFDPKRASAYGGLGNFRQKSYGVECRSLGGYFANPEHLEWVWDKVQEVVNFCKVETNLKYLDTIQQPDTSSLAAINQFITELNYQVK